jgi:transposase
VATTRVDATMLAGARFSWHLSFRLFQHRVMGGSSSAKADTIGQDVEEETVQWTILLASISRWMRPTSAFSIAKERLSTRARRSRRQRRLLTSWPRRRCRRIVFETGRMAPILFHGLSRLGLPVVCIESRQAYQALKSLATHKTDSNDARGLAHLARTGFFKPVHVKSLQAHALRSLIIARKKLVGQRVTMENQIRGLAVVFGIRLPRALTGAFVNRALKAREGVAGLSTAMRGLIAARTAVMAAVAAIDADMRRMTRASAACRRLMTIPGVGQLMALAFVAAIDDPSRIRRSRDIGAYLGLVPRRYQSGEVDYVGGISECGDRRVRTLLYEAANVMLTRYKGQLPADCAFNQAALHPAYPIKRRTSAQRTQASPRRRNPGRASALTHPDRARGSRPVCLSSTTGNRTLSDETCALTEGVASNARPSG